MAESEDRRPEPVPYESRQPLPPPGLTCPKCGGEMRTGVLATRAGLADYYVGRLAWVAGVMRKHRSGFVPPDGSRQSVVTYKCDRCGYLESYGPPG